MATTTTKIRVGMALAALVAAVGLVVGTIGIGTSDSAQRNPVDTHDPVGWTVEQIERSMIPT